MKLVKHVVLLICISMVISKAPTGGKTAKKAKGRKQGKGRKLCTNCIGLQAGHQNPYMHSVMAAGPNYNPYMFNPMMGGMIHPMMPMGLNPFMMGMGPAAMPPMGFAMGAMGQQGAMGGMGADGRMAGMQEPGMYQQGFNDPHDMMKVQRTFYKKYHDALAGDLKKKKPDLENKQNAEETASTAEDVEENENQMENVKRMLNAYNKANGKNKMNYKMSQMGKGPAVL